MGGMCHQEEAQGETGWGPVGCSPRQHPKPILVFKGSTRFDILLHFRRVEPESVTNFLSDDKT
jgi:hypothetical protein